MVLLLWREKCNAREVIEHNKNQSCVSQRKAMMKHLKQALEALLYTTMYHVKSMISRIYCEGIRPVYKGIGYDNNYSFPVLQLCAPCLQL